MRSLTWFVLTIALTHSANAQTNATLTVLEKGTGLPLKRVEVRIGADKKYSNPDGKIDLVVPAGAGKIELYRHSFELLTIPFDDLRTNNQSTVYLYPAAPTDNEVIIQGIKRPETSRKKVSIEEATKVAPGGDPAQVPKLLPGVQSSNFSPSIVVRGSGPEDSKYYIDDQIVPFIFHSIGNISVLPSDLLSDVEFTTGGFGPQYGGATGGVVTLRTKSEIPERPITKFRVNVPVYSSLYHERPMGENNDAMLAISGRRSYLEAFLPFVLQDNDSGLTVTPYFGDAHVYYFKPTDEGHTKILGMGAFDGLKLVFPGGPAEDQDGKGRFDLLTTFYSLALERKQIINREWSLTTTPQIINQSNKIDIVGNRIHIKATSGIVRSELTKRLSRNAKMYIGAEFAIVRGEADILAPQPQPDDPFFDFEEAPKVESKVSETFTEVSLWASRDIEYGSWVYSPGVRTFYTSSIEKSGADPRINARKQIDKKNALKFAVGQYSQTPSFQNTSKDFGNPDLDFIKSYHYVLGIDTAWSDKWQTDFQGFYKETLNLVRSDAETNANNNGSLLSRGFEAFIRRNLTAKFFGWFSYTYSITEERDDDQDTYRNSQYDQTHVVNLVGNYKLTGTWEAGGRLSYHTGDTFTEVDEAVYNANLDKYQQRSDPDQQPYGDRLPDFHQLDLYGTKDILFDTWKMGLRFGLLFLALEPQAQGVQYNYDYSEKEFFRGIPPIPYLEIRGEI